MRRVYLGLALALVTGMTTGALAQSLRSERLVSPRLVDWQIGYYHAADGQVVRKEVPHGQSAEAWQRMVTTERMHLAADMTPAGYVRELAAALTQDCAGARVSPLHQTNRSGHAAVQVRIDCPGSNRTGGQRETAIVLAIAGTSELHVKQIAFRGDMGPADAPWVERYLSGVALCAEGDQAPACTR
jgi:hypothetical protein